MFTARTRQFYAIAYYLKRNKQAKRGEEEIVIW